MKTKKNKEKITDTQLIFLLKIRLIEYQSLSGPKHIEYEKIQKQLDQTLKRIEKNENYKRNSGG
jgi:guanylate kinase